MLLAAPKPSAIRELRSHSLEIDEQWQVTWERICRVGGLLGRRLAVILARRCGSGLGDVGNDVAEHSTDWEIPAGNGRYPVQHRVERLVVENSTVDQPALCRLALHRHPVCFERHRERRRGASRVREEVRGIGTIESADLGNTLTCLRFELLSFGKHRFRLEASRLVIAWQMLELEHSPMVELLEAAERAVRKCLRDTVEVRGRHVEVEAVIRTSGAPAEDL